MALKADVPAVELEDEFDKFFATAIKEEPAKEEPAKEEPAKEEPAKEEPAKEEPAKEEPAKEEPAKEEPVKEDPQIAALKAQIADLEKKIPAPVKEEPKGPTPEELATRKEEEDQFKKFEEDWPQHMDMMRKQHKVIVADVERVIKELLAPVMEKVKNNEGAIAETTQEKMMGKILSVHEDAIELLPEVEGWVEKLPKYQRDAANTILDSGVPADIIELYTAYKEATGKVKPVNTEPTAEELAAEETRKRKLKSLESPKASRTGVAATTDPTDFDGAFKEAILVV